VPAHVSCFMLPPSRAALLVFLSLGVGCVASGETFTLPTLQTSSCGCDEIADGHIQAVASVSICNRDGKLSGYCSIDLSIYRGSTTCGE
jgi:hypothetical protein